MPLQDKANPEDHGLTSAILDHLALHGAKPGPDEIDHRPLPQPDQVELAMATLFNTTISLLDDSQLEDNLEEMLWSLTALFHRRLTHLQRRLDDNECEVRDSMSTQDGSEVASVELERLQMIGLKLWDHRDAFEQMRDQACDHFSATTGSPWMPRTGSKVSHRGLTSAVVDSRAFLSAKRRKEIEVHCPKGTRIAFSGGDSQGRRDDRSTLGRHARRDAGGLQARLEKPRQSSTIQAQRQDVGNPASGFDRNARGRDHGKYRG